MGLRPHLSREGGQGLLRVSFSGGWPLCTSTLPPGHCPQLSALPVSWAVKQKYSGHFNQSQGVSLECGQFQEGTGVGKMGALAV